MFDVFALGLPFIAGTLLGVFFFGGLWWTVKKSVVADNPAFWFIGSLLVRTGVVLAGFYFLSEQHWSRLASSLIGFVVARVMVVKWLAREPLASNATEDFKRDAGEPEHET